jgi:hypothetical protein
MAINKPLNLRIGVALMHWGGTVPHHYPHLRRRLCAGQRQALKGCPAATTDFQPFIVVSIGAAPA